MYARSTLFATALLGTLLAPAALASGFQISETGVSGLGRAFAGNGVAGDSVSDMFANPAGLMQYQGNQVEFALHRLATTAKFENRDSHQLLGDARRASSGPNSDGGSSAVLPNIYYADDITPTLRFGVGVTAPFGLATEYAPDWVGRYAAIKSELRTLEVNPAIAYQIKPKLAIGGGISLLSAEATLSRAQFTGPASPDARATIEGDDVAFGYNLGVMLGDHTARVGIGYRAAVRLNVEGNLVITSPVNTRTSPVNTRAGARTEVTLPQTWYLSGFKQVGRRVDLTATVRHTGWSRFDELRIEFDNGLPDSVTPENWRDTTTLSLGVDYHLNAQWTLRAGWSVDENATSDQYRTARIPDAKRNWLTIGGRYRVSTRTQLDFAAAHITSDEVTLRESSNLVATMPGAFTDNLEGTYTDTSATIVSVSLRVAWGK